jgi:uncharacterized protein (DUF2141 family)
MSRTFYLTLVSSTFFLSVLLWTDLAQAKKTLQCKLESEKVVQGKERRCLYRCSDGTIEGRTRRLKQACLKTVQTANN